MNTHTVHLKFSDIDNTVLQRLRGPLTATSAFPRLGVQVSRRFADFTFTGEAAHAACRAPCSPLPKLPNAANWTTTPSALPPWAKNRRCRPHRTASGQTILFPNQTRQHRRAHPAPNGYIRALLNHDIVFSLTRWHGQNLSGRGRRRADAMEKHQIERIVLVRSAVEAGEKLGFLLMIWRRK